MSTSTIKHLFHLLIFCSFIITTQVVSYLHYLDNINSQTKPHERYGPILTIFLQLIQYSVLLPLPLITFNFLGLVLFNAFPGKIKINDKFKNVLTESVDLPHFCFRVVTRGLYPELVNGNVNKNFSICIESGLSNFSIEVVTDKEICLSNMDNRVRQLVVPTTYKTSTGALFKARALQYALEPHVSQLSDGDYIIHLDEETIVTKDVINGIANFALDGEHSFGQGLITYTNQEIVNWFTTLADFFRVAEDMGKLRFQFKTFHKPIFGWKGSFVVSKYEAERDVSFDHGPDGSVSEDCYFAMIAYMKGYSFDFIQGEMWEKSPFSISDLIKQRRRWLQGLWLVVHSPKIAIPYKFFLALSLYAWVTLPIVGLSYIVAMLFPVPSPIWISCIGSFCFSVSIYMYIFGVIKSFDLKKTNRGMVFVYLIGAVVTIPFNIVIEDIATVWGLFGSKHSFYIVEKDVNRKVVIDV